MSDIPEDIQDMLPEEKSQRRVIAIVGRPNVGKSALFNRITGRRKAIVHSQSGVTRDRLMEEVVYGNERFDLVDTGGICNVDNETSLDKIERGMRAQVDVAIGDAAAAILVVDIESGMHPMDEEVAGILRASGVQTFVAANKADHAGRDEQSSDFLKLGFPVFAVSALHDRGIADLVEAGIKVLPDVENETIENPLKVAVVGKPNVGKSSYINRILRSDRLIVSDVAGTTRDTIDIPFKIGKGDQSRHYLLMDTAGMRRRGKVDTSVEKFSLFRAERSIRRADVVVLVLDCLKGPTAQDKRIASLIDTNRKGCVIVVNKWDLSEETQRAYGPTIAREMPFMSHCPVVFVSALDGFNIRRSIETVDHVASQITTTLPTGMLNRTILDAVAKSHHPVIKGKQLKFYYSTQTGIEPIRITMFVNDPRDIKDAYKRYLTKTLRARFGLEGAPIDLQFRARRKPKKDSEGDSRRPTKEARKNSRKYTKSAKDEGLAPGGSSRVARKAAKGDALKKNKTSKSDGTKAKRAPKSDSRRPRSKSRKK